MAKIIEFKKRVEVDPEKLISSEPWEFRRAGCENSYFIQILRSHLVGSERVRRDLPQSPHYVLKGGMAHTIHSVYSYRNSKEKMRELYYLAGLIDCMINQVSPLLRTDLIRDIYRKVTTLKRVLAVNWYGHMDQVLLPVDDRYFSWIEYREGLLGAKTMKDLYLLIREGTERMFDVLSSEYVFFTPGRGDYDGNERA